MKNKIKTKNTATQKTLSEDHEDKAERAEDKYHDRGINKDRKKSKEAKGK